MQCPNKRGCLPMSCVSAPIVRTLQGTLTQSVESPAVDVEMLGFRRGSPENAPVIFMSALDSLVPSTGRSAVQWLTKCPALSTCSRRFDRCPDFRYRVCTAHIAISGSEAVVAQARMLCAVRQERKNINIPSQRSVDLQTNRVLPASTADLAKQPASELLNLFFAVGVTVGA